MRQFEATSEHPGLTINHARALFQLKRYDEALEVIGAMFEGAGAHLCALAASLRGRILRELGEGQTSDCNYFPLRLP